MEIMNVREYFVVFWARQAMEIMNVFEYFVVFWARQAMPLRTLEPGSVRTWLAVS